MASEGSDAQKPQGQQRYQTQYSAHGTAIVHPHDDNDPPPLPNERDELNRECDDGSCLPSSTNDGGNSEEVEEGPIEDAEMERSFRDDASRGASPSPHGTPRRRGRGSSAGMEEDYDPDNADDDEEENPHANDDDTTAKQHHGSTQQRIPPPLEPYVAKLERYELFSTAQCYYLVACDKAGIGYRVLKMDRTLIERPDGKQITGRMPGGREMNMERANQGAVQGSGLERQDSGVSGSGSGTGSGQRGSPNRQSSGVFPATNPAAQAASGSGPGGSPSNLGGNSSSSTSSPHGPNAHIRPLSEFCIEDPATYTASEIRDMLDMIHEGNRYTAGYDAPHGGPGKNKHGGKEGPMDNVGAGGGLRPICKAYGVVGFVRFLDCYYLTLITKRAKVGSLGGNGIYTIKATETFALKPAERPGGGGGGGGGGGSSGGGHVALGGIDGDGRAGGQGNDPGTMLLSMWNRGKRSVGLGLTNREIAELRYQGLYQVVDLTKNFYFSYTYDVTRSLQENFLAVSKARPFPPPPFKEMYAWNYFLTRELEQCTNSLTSFQWVMPIVHGAFLQRRLNDYGRSLNLTLLARRSRHFAGTRYLKRGVSDQGKVANDVEHEQILHDEASSASSGTFSSYLQVRGSIPTYWTQESSVTLPKPPIVLNRVDPTYNATQAHFADLLRRYGSPIIVVDLVKQSEKREREVIVGNEFRSAIDYLNSHIMDPEHKIRYCALDYSHISKHRNLNVSTSLNETATWAVNQTGFFCSCPRWTISEGGKVEPFDDEAAEARVEMLSEYLGIPAFPMEQKGVLRTNCIDCLDRTNVAQFSAGVEALGQQLVVMGVRNTAKLDPSSNIVRVLIDMFVEIGDHIALQYGGSEAHKKVNTTAGPAANINGPMGKHKELLTSIRRYYSNAFSDRLRQDAMNLFLGYYIPSRHTVPLWELESDYYLHNFHVKSGRSALQAMKLHQRTFGGDWGEGNDRRDDERPALTNGEESWRIERVRRRCKAQNDALSVWWRLAIQQYVQNRMWMDVGSSSYDSLLPDRFERLYQPDKLAQFDKFFGRSWAAPVRLSHSAQHSHSGDENAELMLVHRRAVVSADAKTPARKRKDAAAEDKDEKDSADDEEKSILDFINSHGFASELTPSLRLFISSHKSYHRSIYGNESAASFPPPPPPPSKQQAPKKDRSGGSKKKEKGKDKSKDTEKVSDDLDKKMISLSYLGDLTIKPEPCQEYLEYANFSRRRNPCERKPREAAREEFAKCLQETNLNADNVAGIRKLAESAHINSEIQSGPYRGLKETDSAVGVTAVVQEQLNNIDSMRRRGERLGRGGLSSVDSDLRQRRMDKPSIKEAIYRGYSNASRAEQAYSEIIDTSSLGCHRSDLTDESSMKLYCSFFDESTALSKLDRTYVTGRRLPADTPQPKIRDRAGLSNAGGDVAPYDEDFRPSHPTRWSKERAEKKSPSLFSYETRRSIPEGFEQINDDMFARRDNRFVVFNGTGLESWRKDSKEPRTKIHGLEDDVLVGFSRNEG